MVITVRELPRPLPIDVVTTPAPVQRDEALGRPFPGFCSRIGFLSLFLLLQDRVSAVADPAESRFSPSPSRSAHAVWSSPPPSSPARDGDPMAATTATAAVSAGTEFSNTIFCNAHFLEAFFASTSGPHRHETGRNISQEFCKII